MRGELHELDNDELLRLADRTDERLRAVRALSAVAIHGYFRGRLNVRATIAEIEGMSNAVEAEIKARMGNRYAA